MGRPKYHIETGIVRGGRTRTARVEGFVPTQNWQEITTTVAAAG